LETRKTDNVATAPETLNAEYQYVWSQRIHLPAGRQVDSPVLRDRDGDATESGVDERLYYLNDGNFNVTGLVDPNGDVVERYQYDPYGQLTVLNGAADSDANVVDWSADADNTSDYANSILFCGYFRDAETLLYHVRNRMYHPPLGRWLQRDPLVYVDGMNGYAYGVGSPLGYIDAQGTQSMGTCSITDEDKAFERDKKACRDAHLQLPLQQYCLSGRSKEPDCAAYNECLKRAKDLHHDQIGGDACCDGKRYFTSIQTCCGKKIYRKETRRCCKGARKKGTWGYVVARYKTKPKWQCDWLKCVLDVSGQRPIRGPDDPVLCSWFPGPEEVLLFIYAEIYCSMEICAISPDPCPDKDGHGKPKY